MNQRAGRSERLGVIGLGNIGGAIHANLVADGHDVVGIDIEGDPADVGARSDVTLLSLPTPEVVETVAARWATAAPAGTVLVDLSTSAPSVNRELERRLAASGHHFVEAPLTGGAWGAQGRTLVFMVGGEPEPVEKCRPILESLGRAVFHLGPVGTGSAMKLINSLLAFTSTWVSLEALSLAETAGIDLKTAIEVVRTGGAGNFFIDKWIDNLDNRGRPAQFALRLAAKDARLVEAFADESGIRAPVAAAIREVLADAVERGLGDHDWSDLVLAAEQRANLDLRLSRGEDLA